MSIYNGQILAHPDLSQCWWVKLECHLNSNFQRDDQGKDETLNFSCHFTDQAKRLLMSC